jgi:putative SOS response-associated peptidase YedK
MIRVLLLAMLAICSRHVLCGRFNLTRPKEVVERFGFMDWTEKRIEPRFNIAPSQEILTIVQLPQGPAFAQTATWGLKPFWLNSATGSAKKPPPINARAESLASSPMFRDALLTGRCLIPATGFFEWRALAPNQRQPMHIGLKDGGVFAFAGLWLPPAERGGLPSAAIITTRPNALMATIHTRMPAILLPEQEQAWLAPSATDALQLLGPYPAELMHAYPVSALVNSWENESPAVLEPATPPSAAIQEALPFAPDGHQE